MECPYCRCSIEILEVNCGIFRCGVYKETGIQIPPHLPKEECDKIQQIVWGCTRPFKYDGTKLIPCDYI